MRPEDRRFIRGLACSVFTATVIVDWLATPPTEITRATCPVGAVAGICTFT